MPSEDGPLGPSNRWYKPGFIQNELLKLSSNPYLEEIIRVQIHPLIVDERYPIVLDKIKKIIS